MQRLSIPLFFIILSCILTGCSLSVPTPTELTMIFTEPFLCGYTYHEAGAQPQTVSLLRDETGDLLTVYGENATTVFFYDGITLSLRTGGSADTPPLILPIPYEPQTGSASSLPLFSVTPDDGFTVSRTDDGFLVASEDGS